MRAEFPHHDAENSTTDKARTAQWPGFVSFKCIVPIRYSNRIFRDALIQSTLDKSVETIGPDAQIPDEPSDVLFAYSVQRNGRPVDMLVCDGTDGRIDRIDLSRETIAISRRRLVHSDAAITARMVWARRDLQVEPIFLVKALSYLQQYPDGLDIMAFENLSATAGRSWVDFLLSMACRGLVALELNDHLTDRTLVTIGPRARTAIEADERHENLER